MESIKLIKCILKKLYLKRQLIVLSRNKVKKVISKIKMEIR